jgi:hypothetical protein
VVKYTERKLRHDFAQAVKGISKDLSQNPQPTLSAWIVANGVAAQHGMIAALKDVRKSWVREHVKRYRLVDLSQLHIWRRGRDWSCAPEIVVAPGMTRPLESGKWTDDQIRIFLTAWWRVSHHIVDRSTSPRVTKYSILDSALRFAERCLLVCQSVVTSWRTQIGASGRQERKSRRYRVAA